MLCFILVLSSSLFAKVTAEKIESELWRAKSKTFKAVAGFKSKDSPFAYNLGLKLKNKKYSKQSKSAKEVFIAQSVLYFNDPSYPCREPILNKYFKEVYGELHWLHDCASIDEVLIHSTNPQLDLKKSVVIDFSRVFEIHYLEGTPSTTDKSATFGHSMLRLVICAPERVAVGPECLKDRDHHLVASYGVLDDNRTFSTLKSIFGGYRARLFMYTFNDIADYYQISEYRKLLSYPLILSNAEQDDLLKKLIYDFWSYDGDYYLTSNNCAHEIFDVLRMVKAVNGSLFSKHSNGMKSPKNLTDHLFKRGVLNSEPLKNFVEAEKNGYYFPAKIHRIRKAYSKLKQTIVGLPRKYQRFLKRSQAANRNDLWTELKSDSEISAALLLEKVIYARELRNMPKYMKKFIPSRDLLEKAYEGDDLVLTNESAYGQPLKHELVTNDVVEHYIQWKKSVLRVRDEFLARFKNRSKKILEVSLIKENIGSLQARLDKFN